MCGIFQICECDCSVEDKVRKNTIDSFKSIDLLTLGWNQGEQLSVLLKEGSVLVVTKGDVYTVQGWQDGFYVTVYRWPISNNVSFCFAYPMGELGLEEHFEFT